MSAAAPVERVHGSAVALPDGAGGWQGVLLRGTAGAGKSDLALRLIDGGARLVADDQVELTAVAGTLVARASAAIAGRIEVRGLGIVEVPALEAAQLCLVCDLVARESVERLPLPATVEIAGVRLPCLRLAPFEASVTAKLRVAVRAAGHGIMPGTE